MKTQSAEITVALIGNVSAGKTTLLNALLQAKFSEVSMKRTTTGANYFRIHVKTSSGKSTPDLWTIPPANPRSSDSILKEISNANHVKIRKGDKIAEKTFDVELDESIVDCRKNTSLVIVDIPGINEAHTDEEYKEYVSNKWNTFDCVIVVMDGKQGVNTQEQVFLLDFVKQNLITKKKISVIILCNKIDDPKDEEQAELVREAQNEVDKTFNSILDPSQIAFIPISSIHAYFYQCASTMTMDQFRSFDVDLIERLGRDQVGRRRWSKMTNEEKLQEAYNIVSDRDTVKEALRDSNFENFLSTLRNFVGGESKQFELIEKQLEVSRNQMLEKIYRQGKIISSYRTLYERTKNLFSLDRVEDCLKDIRISFWTAYRNYEDHCISQFIDSGVRDVDVLAGPMEELIEYFRFIVKNEAFDEIKPVQMMAMKLVRKKIHLLVSTWTKTTEENASDEMMSYFSPVDWCTIWSSILLLSYNKHFCLHLGQEKLMIERYSNYNTFLCFSEYGPWSRSANKVTSCPKCLDVEDFSQGEAFGNLCYSCKSCFPKGLPFLCMFCNSNINQSTLTCQSCKYQTYPHAGLNHYLPLPAVESDPLLQQTFSPTIDLPVSIEDPKHYGHILFKFCYLMDRCEEIKM